MTDATGHLVAKPSFLKTLPRKLEQPVLLLGFVWFLVIISQPVNGTGPLLGFMGRNFLLNMADHGHSGAGYDKDATKVAALHQEAENRDIRSAADIEEFIALLRKPSAIMMPVPAGAPGDSVIKDLLPRFDKGDLIIDAGNSYFKDTDVRACDSERQEKGRNS